MVDLVSRRVGSADVRTLIWAWSFLIVIGAAWGLTFSLARAATTKGAHPLGVLFWECAIAGVLLSSLVTCRRIPMPISASLIRFHFMTGLVGMVIPGAAFFYAAAHVPAGILSITIGIVPIITFVGSAIIGLEKLELGRVLGVILGTLAIILLVTPEGSLPDRAQLPWVILGFASAASFAAMNLLLALKAPPGANSFMLTCGMFVAASLFMVPVLYVTDSFVPLGWPLSVVEWSVLGLGTVNAIAYPLYFKLIDHAGPVFGSFTANLVTLFGVFWGIVIFSEQNSIWVWLSFLTIMIALGLVAPRRRAALTN